MNTSTQTRWTPRKQLVVMASKRISRNLEPVLRGSHYRWAEAAKVKAHEMIEDVISQWIHAGENSAAVEYYMGCSDQALERLIMDVLKEKS